MYKTRIYTFWKTGKETLALPNDTSNFLILGNPPEEKILILILNSYKNKGKSQVLLR